MEEEIQALQAQGLTRENAEVQVMLKYSGLGPSPESLKAQMGQTYPPFLMAGEGGPNRDPNYSETAAKNIDYSDRTGFVPNVMSAGSEGYLPTDQDKAFENFLNEGMPTDEAYEKAYENTYGNNSNGEASVKSNRVPLTQMGGFNLETHAANIGRFAGQEEGTRGRGLGLAASIGGFTLGAARTGLSNYAAQRQSNVAQEYYDKEKRNSKYTAAPQSSDVNIKGGYMGAEGGTFVDGTFKNKANRMKELKDYLPNGGVFGGPGKRKKEQATTSAYENFDYRKADPVPRPITQDYQRTDAYRDASPTGKNAIDFENNNRMYFDPELGEFRPIPKGSGDSAFSGRAGYQDFVSAGEGDPSFNVGFTVSSFKNPMTGVSGRYPASVLQTQVGLGKPELGYGDLFKKRN